MTVEITYATPIPIKSIKATCCRRGRGMTEITEEWLASVGFKYREPEDRQTFRHWTLTFSEPDDYGLYIKTTAPGWFNRRGEHINADSGWYLWVGRGTQQLHLRHVFNRQEIVALVEALIGAKWEPTKAGNVRVHRRPDTPVDGGGE